ncbi:molybdopterin converting factor subunit 1 [Hydrogenophaga sp. 5NK40-0174]|uniref:molybdopterin converting factor subunit 1 n=1 Tax=Hydrogenophaga sp. 5NK40-0174 TaxID=3127649 RepID=UPI00333EB5DE
MKVKIRYFASIRETIGQGAESAETSASTVGELRDELIARNEAYAEALSRSRAVRVALNQVMADESAGLAEGAEIGFFPPVTGG